MFQASLLKRASRYAVPAAAAAAGGVAGIAFANDKDYHVERRSVGNGNVALCEEKKKESVMGMLGDIQERVRFL